MKRWQGWLHLCNLTFDLILITLLVLPCILFDNLYSVLGGHRVHAHVAPTRKMDVFCFSFSSPSSSVRRLSPLGVAQPLNNGLAVIMT